MTRQTQLRFVRFGFAAWCVAGLAVPAAAQDARVRVVIPDIAQDIIREVQRSVDRLVVRDIMQELNAALLREPDLRALRSLRGLRDFNLRGGFDVQNTRDFRVRQESRETKTVKIGANGALDLRNLGGDITVIGGAGPDTVVEILRVSRGRTEADAKLGLERVTVSVDQRGERATVEAHYPDERRPPYAVEVSYTVKTPAGTRITTSSAGGNMTVTDIKADISTSTMGGNTTITGGRSVSVKSLGGDVRISGTTGDGTVEAETYGGQVTLTGITARRIHATTIGGNVSADGVTSADVDLGTMGGEVRFSGPLEKNGRYDLHTNAGTVLFRPSGTIGYELTASTFAGQVRFDGVTLQVSGPIGGRGANRSIRGTVGDGSATVNLRTFSGDVVVSKGKE